MRRTALRRRLRLFGAGNRSLFDFGPNRSFEAVGGLLRVAGGRRFARRSTARPTRHVDIRDAFLPVLVTGRVRAGVAAAGATSPWLSTGSSGG